MPFNKNLIGWWRFTGDARDHSGRGNHGRGFGVDFAAPGRHGQPGTAARFNGVDASIEVPDAESLRLGTGDLTLAAWVRTPDLHDGVPGDIVSKWDDRARRGFNLSIKGSSAGYNSMGDARNVHFGIDNAMDNSWEDCGKPWPSNTYVSSLTVWKGDLYAGLADAAGDGRKACHVFRYGGRQRWLDCGRVGDSLKTRSVYSMIVHRGEIFCGTGRYDWWSVNSKNCDFVRVYRYGSGQEWIDCGQPGHNYRILSLATYRGDLYAGTDAMGQHPDSGKVYRWAGGTEWVDCGRLGNQYHVFALTAHHGRLFGGTQWGEIYRYEGGTEWTYLGRPFGNTQIHCLQTYRGALYAGTWHQGYVVRWEGGQEWTECGVLGGVTGRIHGETDHPQVSPINEVNELTVYNGKLYAGVIPKAEVYRYEAGREWTMVRRLVAAPDYDPEMTDGWSRVPCLTVFKGRLYAGTSTCRGVADAKSAGNEAGRVFSTMAGQAISFDDDLGSEWRHVAAVREGGRLRLCLDGRVVAMTGPFPAASYNLATDRPLRIGFGAVDYFTGDMEDVRLYDRALTEPEIAALANLPRV